MIKYITMIGCCVSGLSHAFAADALVWPQSDAFYNGQVEQNYHTVDSASMSGGRTSQPTPSVGYVQPNPKVASAYNAQNPNYYLNNWGSYVPNMGYPYNGYVQPNYYPPVNNGMNNMPYMGSFMNPSNMSGFGFPSFPFSGSNMFMPFGH